MLLNTCKHTWPFWTQHLFVPSSIYTHHFSSHLINPQIKHYSQCHWYSFLLVTQIYMSNFMTASKSGPVVLCKFMNFLPNCSICTICSSEWDWSFTKLWMDTESAASALYKIHEWTKHYLHLCCIYLWMNSEFVPSGSYKFANTCVPAASRHVRRF